ncbi:MAG: bifunctional YncE family protein/alkaline phosphatase family protein [Verrucomicrobia bacterium]|nr:bifunctional YncE family protein/alkaline phosphatase family protein [Verrucomicrobiota bacterium]
MNFLRFVRCLCGAGFHACLFAAAFSLATAERPPSMGEHVGRTATNHAVTPVNQIVTPAGTQVELPGLRPQTLALSPDGRLLVTAGKTSELVVVDPATRKILQRVTLPSEKQNEPRPGVVSPNILQPDEKGQVSFTGLIFSPDGRRIYLSNVNGSIKVFNVAADGTVTGSHSIPLPLANAPRRKEEIPAGLAVSLDGKKLYIALNLSNRLGEFDTATGKLLRAFEVGGAPYDVALAAGKAYVSNWGGRRPQPGDLTGPAGRGTEVKVDPVTHIANEGSVTVIDLETGVTRTEVLVHLHSSALAVTPDFRHVVCANAASDNLSVVETATDRVIETIWVKQSPADLFGASPNALAFDAKGKTLYVANGTQNAVAIVEFNPGKSQLLGLIPVGWFPGALVFDAPRKALCVANIKGLPAVMKTDKQTGQPGFNSHQYSGSLSLVPVPSRKALPALSAIAWKNYRREQIAFTKLPPRPGQPARPVPERIGEPSVFKHVVYVIKENRTYDQVLGDVKAGNGDASLCIFGERITPNQHRLVREFALLDNTYCCGILSADGHQWSTTAFATDYMEKSFAGFPRSYPDGMGEDETDALAYAPTGFLWDNALKHGKTLRNYGEFALPAVRWADKRKGDPKWADCWREFRELTGEIIFASTPAVASLRPHLATNSVGWDMAVPDQFRAKYFINELKQFEVKGEFPNLVIICLPNDHTSGTKAGTPTPAAYVADNDLAFGQIVEAISRSKFWRETAIFAIEDDPQAGFDHVSGYRTTAYCISPYTRRGTVVSTQYNTTSLIRTMEQILGLPPMNQFDATATPMFDCFTDTPDFTPFTAVPNNVPLDQMNLAANTIKDPLLRQHANASARMNFKQPDKCPEDLLNRILWHAMKGSAASYPAWAITVGAKDWDD